MRLHSGKPLDRARAIYRDTGVYLSIQEERQALLSLLPIDVRWRLQPFNIQRKYYLS
jgi:hypothetical protein